MNKYPNVQDRIYAIDPSLTLVKRLGPSSVAVYLVENAYGKYVLKMSRDYAGPLSAHLVLRDNHLITREQAVLNLLRGVKGITQMKRTYNFNGQPALLKSYQEGDNFFEYTPNDEDFNALEKTITEIHKRGVAGLLLNDSDIVKPSDRSKQPVIVDPGLGINRFDKNISKRQFNQAAEKDYKFLQLLFDTMDY
jgi:hypothetical protein